MKPTSLPQTRPDRASAQAWHAVVAILTLIALALTILALMPRAAALAAGEARATILAEGRQEFAENCAGCHGDDGKGGGDLAAKLVKPPKDLTLIGQESGGRFPFWRIFDVIAGEAAVPGHDTHQMPEFFASLKKQDFKPGYLPAHVRILELTHYLEGLQAK